MRIPFKRTIVGVSTVVVIDKAGLLPGQTSANLSAIKKGVTNAAIAIPVLARCAYDYSSSLKGIEYPSEEYNEVRKKCHERSALRVLWCAEYCGGIYLKAGQYIGSLEGLAPIEYT
jgi:aarF domain-containing kinase